MGDSMMGVDPESDAIAAAENARYGLFDQFDWAVSIDWLIGLNHIRS